MARQRRKKPSLKFFIILAVAFLVIAGAVLFVIFGLGKSVQLETGSVTFKESYDGVIIRNENVFEADNYARAVFIATEGENVSPGTKIAEVFKWGYNDKLLKDLTELQKTIKEYQENNLLKDVVNKGLIEINDKINAKLEEILQVISGEVGGDIVLLERELKGFLTERMNFLKNSFNADPELNKFYDQEIALKDKIASWQIDIVADSDGIASFYFDDLERVMNPANLENITINIIDDVLKGLNNSVVSDAKTAKPLYRIVNPNDWYVLLMTPAAVPEFKDGMQVSLVFEDILEKEYTGTIMSGRPDPKGFIYVLKVTDSIDELLSARKVKTMVVKKFDGLMVPKEAVKEKDGLSYVNVKAGGSTKMEPVNVLITQNGSSVVEPVSPGALSAGATVEY